MSIELVMIVALFVAIARIAAFSRQSVILWCAANLLILTGTFYIVQTPYFRILVAGLLTYTAMLIYNIAADK